MAEAESARRAPRLRVHPLFVLLLALAAAGGLFREVALLLVSLLAHEAAHVAAAVALGLQVTEVELLPFGGVARIAGLDAAEPAVEATVSLAGPLGSLLLYGAATWLMEHGWAAGGLGGFYRDVNLALGTVNLLPALPLDGGRVARALLAGPLGFGRATLAVVRTGRVTAVALAVGGALAWQAGVVAPGAFVFAAFAWVGSGRQRWLGDLRTWREMLCRAAAVRGRGGTARIQPLAVNAEAPLQSILRSMAPGRYHLIWVLAPDGRVLGVADEADLVAAMTRHGPLAPAGRLLERPPGV